MAFQPKAQRVETSSCAPCQAPLEAGASALDASEAAAQATLDLVPAALHAKVGST